MEVASRKNTYKLLEHQRQHRNKILFVLFDDLLHFQVDPVVGLMQHLKKYPQVSNYIFHIGIIVYW